MPNEQTVTGSPDQGTGQADSGQQSSQQNTQQSGNRADTSRAGGQQNAGQQNTQQQAAAEQRRKFEYDEDRTDWLPRHRLNEVSGRLTKAEQRAQELEQQVQDRDRKLRLAMGVEQQDPNEVEDEKARAVLKRLFPVLENLSQDDLQELLELRKSGQQIQQTVAQQWSRHADEMLGELRSGFAKSLGQESLTESQTKRISLAYVQEAEACQRDRQKALREYEAYGSTNYNFENDFLARHDKGDKTLLQEFIKSYSNDFFEPARRAVTRTVGGRVAVPNGRGRTPGAAARPQRPNLADEGSFKDALAESIARHTS